MRLLTKIGIISIVLVLLSGLVSAGWTPPGLGVIYESPLHVMSCDNGDCADENQTDDGVGNASYSFTSTGSARFIDGDRNSTSGGSYQISDGANGRLENASALVMKTDYGVLSWSQYINSTPGAGDQFFLTAGGINNGAKELRFGSHFEVDTTFYSARIVDESGNIGMNDEFIGDGDGCMNVDDSVGVWVSHSINWSPTSMQYWINDTLCQTSTAGNTGEFGAYFTDSTDLSFGVYASRTDAVSIVVDEVAFWNVQSTATNDIIGHYHRGDWDQSIGLSSCGTITESTTLLNDLTSTGTCMTLGTKNIFLDCDHHVITYGTDGGSNTKGVFATSQSNVTVKNCYIQEGTAGTAQHAIYYSAVSSGKAFNNTLLTSGSTSNAIECNNCDDGFYYDNLINLTGASARGINFLTGADGNVARNNVINTTGTTATVGIRLRSLSNDNYLESNTIYSGDVGIYATNVPAGGNWFINNNITAPNDKEIRDSAGDGPNYLIYNNSFGRIEWIHNASGGFAGEMNVDADAGSGGMLFGPGGTIFIGDNVLAFDSSIYGAGLDGETINSTVNISLTGLSLGSVDQILKVDGFETDRNTIITNGLDCLGSTCALQSYSSGLLQFNTTGFSSYTAIEDLSTTWQPPTLTNFGPRMLVTCGASGNCEDLNLTDSDLNTGWSQSVDAPLFFSHNGTGWGRQVLDSLDNPLRNTTDDVMDTDEGAFCFSYYLNSTPAQGERLLDGGLSGGGFDHDFLLLWGENPGENHWFFTMEGDGQSLQSEVNNVDCVAGNDTGIWHTACLNWSATAIELQMNGASCGVAGGFNSGTAGPYSTDGGGIFIGGRAGLSHLDAVYSDFVWWDQQGASDLVLNYNNSNW